MGGGGRANFYVQIYREMCLKSPCQKPIARQIVTYGKNPKVVVVQVTPNHDPRG